MKATSWYKRNRDADLPCDAVVTSGQTPGTVEPVTVHFRGWDGRDLSVCMTRAEAASLGAMLVRASSDSPA